MSSREEVTERIMMVTTLTISSLVSAVMNVRCKMSFVNKKRKSKCCAKRDFL